MNNLDEEKYLLVAASVLPDVFLRVLRAKELLASGEAKNVSRATKMVDVSRSAFYKYKDSVFRADTGRDVFTLTAALLDETGALQNLLAAISGAGAGVVTINQNMPENGAAVVAVTVRTQGMEMDIDTLCEELKKQRTVVDIKRSK
ncbi:ACT domain-containing protein [Ruminococcaceae bacterium OttesenSCG-928-A16]|nr:ACT domain-containing protein [Ruminococcaceae bacterium OttesenSCG-928-A16]